MTRNLFERREDYCTLEHVEFETTSIDPTNVNETTSNLQMTDEEYTLGQVLPQYQDSIVITRPRRDIQMPI